MRESEGRERKRQLCSAIRHEASIYRAAAGEKREIEVVPAARRETDERDEGLHHLSFRGVTNIFRDSGGGRFFIFNVAFRWFFYKGRPKCLAFQWIFDGSN